MLLISAHVLGPEREPRCLGQAPVLGLGSASDPLGHPTPKEQRKMEEYSLLHFRNETIEFPGPRVGWLPTEETRGHM